MLLLLLGCFAALRKQYLCLVSDEPPLLQNQCPDSNGNWYFYLMDAFKIIKDTPSSLGRNNFSCTPSQVLCCQLVSDSGIIHFSSPRGLLAQDQYDQTYRPSSQQDQEKLRGFLNALRQHQGWFRFWGLFLGCSELCVLARPVKIWESLHFALCKTDHSRQGQPACV